MNLLDNGEYGSSVNGNKFGTNSYQIGASNMCGDSSSDTIKAKATNSENYGFPCLKECGGHQGTIADPINTS